MADIVLAANSHLKELTTNSQVFLHCLAHAKIVPPLRNLKLESVQDLPTLHSFLLRVSSLVRWPEEAKGLPGTLPLGAYLLKNVDFSLSLTSFPNLRRLICPSHLAYLFTGPHSLELISLSQKMDKDVQDLRKEEDLELSVNTRLLMEMPNPTVHELALPYAFVKGSSKEGSGSRELESWRGHMSDFSPNLKCLCISVTGGYVKLNEFQDMFRTFLETWGVQSTYLLSLNCILLQALWRLASLLKHMLYF
ncbi:hypothetical protein BT96DRAFT_685628 [Gymnopus androsaceus JB14]|uniref:Uncharacterized protein n=1 Tax=Gymnopus androsaceus JB14 TaxID=1447944 RepID=A0A6A4GET2_9AGAR|nr:hypothetical protein BT96DRAFT_685628 [Gymnopus androsaceus JB14]